jgi:catechol 2,3-dioxygenase-like lactoylglutathione lyase family enzyme
VRPEATRLSSDHTSDFPAVRVPWQGRGGSSSSGAAGAEARRSEETSVARIRHLAIKSTDPERLANFYEQAFGMETIHRSPNGGVYMTDGYLTLALLKNRPGDMPSGINHFGFQVEDARELTHKLKQMGSPEPTQRPATTPYAELRGMDPDGNQFDISEHGYADVEYPPERERKTVKKSPEKVG